MPTCRRNASLFLRMARPRRRRRDIERASRFSCPTVGEVKFWEIIFGKEAFGFHADRDAICSMALSPDGRLLAVTSEASAPGFDALEPGPVKVWDVSRVTAWPINEKRSTKLSSEKQRELWSDLTSENTLRALTAVRRWVQVGAQASAFLGARLQAEPR